MRNRWTQRRNPAVAGRQGRASVSAGKRTLTQSLGRSQRRAPGASPLSPGKRTRTQSLARRRRRDGPARAQAAERNASGPAAVRERAEAGVRGAGRELPHREAIQESFGRHDVSAVGAHVGGEAADAATAIDAEAYAVGGDVAFRHPPDLHTAAHEAAHVVQQRGGVQPKGGVSEEGDAYERHADAVADAVVAGRSAERLLDEHAGIADDARARPRAARTVARRGGAANTVTTPEEPPDAIPPAVLAPPDSEPHYDAEGNEIARAGDKWYLVEEPESLAFPLKAPYKHQLLPINPNMAYASLMAECIATREEQRSYADQLEGDQKKWFALVYYYVTKHEIEAILAGEYHYPHMKMQEVLAFHRAYKENLDAWNADNEDAVEQHWRIAFEEAEGYNDGSFVETRSLEIFHALLPSMQAHIRFDLPRAIASVFTTHYAGIPEASIQDFQADFEAMDPVFAKAQQSILPDIKQESFFFDPGSWGWAQDMGSPFLFHIGIERGTTWDKTEMLADAMQEGDAVEREMRATVRVASPYIGHEAFEVRGTDISEFDWQGQPGGVPATPSAPAPVQEPAPDPPAFPERLYFKLGRPGADESKLENAVRTDQDLAPYRDLALWTQQVSGASVALEGHASSEGSEASNLELANLRTSLVDYFLYMLGGDVYHNDIIQIPIGEEGAEALPEWRYVRVRILDPGLSKQQQNAINTNLPGEVSSGGRRD